MVLLLKILKDNLKEIEQDSASDIDFEEINE